MLKNLGKHVVFFIILIVLTFFFLIRGENYNDIVRIVSEIDIKYVILGILMMFFYILGDAINSKMLLANFGYKMSIFKTLKYGFIGFFYSAITPSSSGGQPMQLYHMSKDKISVSHGTVVLLLEAIAYHLIALVYMAIGAIYNGGYLIDNLKYFTVLFIMGITGTVCILTVLLGFLFSKRASNVFSKIAIWLIKKFKKNNSEEAVNKLTKELKNFKDSSDYIKKNKKIIIRMLIIMFLQMTAFHSVSYITACALGIDISYFKILTLQAVLFSSVTSIPLPGSMGISELGYSVIFTPIYGEKIIASATIITRFMNFYFFVLLSFVVSLITYIKETKKSLAK